MAQKDIKQVIVLRKDLNMRKGKMAAQASHASLGAFMASITQDKSNGNLYEVDSEMVQDWLYGNQKKIVVGCENYEDLMRLAEAISETRIPFKLITDSGLTEFHGVPTETAIGIGPYFSEDIDNYTRHLPLL